MHLAVKGYEDPSISDAELRACRACREYGSNHPTISVGGIKLIHKVVHLSKYEHKTKKRK